MLLISALALGLVESTSSNAGANLGYSIGGSAGSGVNVGSVAVGGRGGEAIIAGGSVAASQSLSSAIVRSISEGGSSGGGSGTLSWDNNGTFKTAGPGEWSFEQCLMWQRPHHLYYQLSNAFFFLAFLAPHGPFGMVWLRSIIIVGCVLMAMWGWLVECTPDIVLWSILFLVVNVIYLIVLLCRLRPIRFDKEIEAVYEALFKPLRVSRHQFKKVLNCMKLVRALKYQEVYAQEKVTKVDSLSLVLAGKLVVSQNQRALHIVFPHQFLDSPEWFGVSTDDYFQVSIMAMEESRVLIWHRDKLKLSIMAEPFLQAVFDHILGRDVVKKLMQVTQYGNHLIEENHIFNENLKILHTVTGAFHTRSNKQDPASQTDHELVSETIAGNGFLPMGCYDDEEKPMLMMKKGSEGHGLTALINRQLQANDPNAWRLGRIDETDHETAV